MRYRKYIASPETRFRIMRDIPVDERGIPTELDGDGYSAPHCPPKPCDLCTGDSASTRLMGPGELERVTSWEWCQEMDTCAATVNWDLIAETQR